jgi:hypothetical protein
MDIQILNSSAGHFEFSTQSEPNNVYVLSQMTNVGTYFEKFLVEQQFDTIVEVGTYKGGLAILLDEVKQKHSLKFDLHTLDIGVWDESSFSEVAEAFTSRSITFKQVDIFSKSGTKYVTTLLKSPKKKVCILCDGGDKVQEFNLFSKYIKQGDFIMAHDYHHNSVDENDEQYNCSWSWREICYTDIEQSIITEKLKMEPTVRFPEVAWACYKKA